MPEEKASSTRETKKKPKPAKAGAKTAAAPLEKKNSELEKEIPAPVAEMPEKESTVVTASAAPVAPNPATASSSAPSKVAPFKTGDDYTLLVHYDKSQRLFIAEVAEFPRLSCSGVSREEVVRELSVKLEDYLEDIRHQVSQLPEPIYSRQYPEKLEISLSQSLFRKLDLLSRQEKVALERLVSELLSASIERRFGGGGGEKRFQPQQPQSNQGGQGHHRHGGHGHRHHGRQQGRHGGGNVDSRENFLEYVRNLEKGGGNWRKK